ncbi:MAG: carboxypeptidase regulatory-like domain-containing protein [Gemmatimonadetes bacterium]|nr:carboxypeptidase regulatory-like domain-containing protein [Gemmatimonadota bacterium]
MEVRRLRRRQIGLLLLLLLLPAALFAVIDKPRISQWGGSEATVTAAMLPVILASRPHWPPALRISSGTGIAEGATASRSFPSTDSPIPGRPALPVAGDETSVVETAHPPGPEAAPVASVDTTPRTPGRPAAIADPFDDGLFELRLVDVPSLRTVHVLIDGSGRPLLPLTAILHYLEIPHRSGSNDIVLEWPPPTWRASLGLNDRSLQLPGSSSFILPAEWELRPEELFLSVDVVQRIIGADVHVDWENLRILIGSRGDFPISARIANEARRGRLAGRNDRFADGDDHSIGYSMESGGFAAGWQVAVGATAATIQTTARATVGAAVLGGSLRVGSGFTTLNSGDARMTPAFLQYARAFSRDSPVRQLRVGEVLSDGLVGRSLDGFTLSNDPFYTPEYFGQVLVEPVVPAGWEYEVYQGDQLLGVSTRGETRPIPTDLGYGTNPLRIRLIGPAGQERIQELVYLVPAMQVPAGNWRYRAGAGRCRDSSCSFLSYGDLRHGISERSTLGIGLETGMRADSAGWARPYALMSHSPRPDLRLEARAQWQTLLQGSIQRPGMRGGWQMSGGWSSGEAGTGSAVPHWFTDGSAALPMPGISQPVFASTRLRGSSATGPDAWVTSLGTIVQDVHLRAGYERGFQREDVISLHASRRLPTSGTGLLRDLTVATEADMAGSNVRHASVGLTARPFDHSTITSSLRWLAGSRTPQLSVSLVSRTPAAYLQTVANGGRDVASWFASASGGLAYSREYGHMVSPIDALGQTGVAGQVFLDNDGDGVLGEGDEPISGAPVSVGGSRVMTDETGSYRHWGVLPHMVVRVGVDTLAFARSDLSAGSTESVRAVPNIFTRVDLPVVRTRELIGRIEWAGGEVLATGGVTVEAEQIGGGAIQRAITFSDGEFYFPRLQPGDYTVRVAESSLDALRAVMEGDEMRITVPGGTGGRPIQTPSIMLSRPETGWE